MEIINGLLEIGRTLSEWILAFWNTLTQPLANSLGYVDPVVGGVLNFILGLFGADIYTTSLVALIFGFSVTFFLLFHFVKFIVGIVK